LCYHTLTVLKFYDDSVQCELDIRIKAYQIQYGLKIFTLYTQLTLNFERFILNWQIVVMLLSSAVWTRLY